MRKIGLLCLFVFLSFNTSVAQVSVGESGTLGGRVYSDFYWMAQNNNEDIEGQTGFWFRRIYLTYENDLSGAFSTRVRLEAASEGDFDSGNEMVPNIKDAYLKWEKNYHQIYAGISSTPTFGLTEDVWAYRSVSKSPQDLYDFGSSRDFGLSFKGEFGQNRAVNYHFFVGNGNSNAAEIDRGKKVMLSLSYDITDKLIVQGYFDWNNRTDDPSSRDSYTTQVFAGYQSEMFNLGALYSYQHREPNSAGTDSNLDLISLFGNAKFSDTVNGYLRADHLFDSYRGGSDNSYIPFEEGVESTYLVGGADILLQENIHLMPNIQAIVYGENPAGLSPETDIMPRLTLFYEF